MAHFTRKHIVWQATAVRSWQRCGGAEGKDKDSIPKRTSHPSGAASSVVPEAPVEEENGTAASAGGSRCRQQQDAGNRGHRDQGHRARRDESPSSPPCSVSDYTTPASGQPGDVVIVRSPSPASSLATATVAAATGRLWGDDATEGTPPPDWRRTGGGGGGGIGTKASEALKARGGRKKGGIRTWVGGRRPHRDTTELADWIETNTNLVHVSPW